MAGRSFPRLMTRRHHDFFMQLGQLLVRTTHLTILMRRLVRFLADEFARQQVICAVRQGDEFLIVGTQDTAWLRQADLCRFARDHYRQADRGKPIIVSQIASPDMRHLLQAHAILIVLPLFLQEECVGYVLLGEQPGRLRPHELRLLERASSELAIALRNAVSMQQIQQLNDALQQRISDATKELRISNRQLQRLDAAKNEFISMASHQLRTPLTSIKGYLDMVLEGDAGALTAAQRQMLSEAFLSSERLVQLINDFLNVSRLQTGTFVINRQPTQLNVLVDEAIALLEVVATQHHVELRRRVQARLPEVLADRDKLSQVILNMIDNAIYYSRPQTVVTISLRQEQGYLVFQVADHGIGVPPAEQPRLFQKFFRATNAQRKRPDGTGVGLYLAKKVVLAHGGTIIFRTHAKGSVFGFRLPLAE